MTFGFWEILIILAIVFFIFGAKRLPEIGRSLASGIREFKKESRATSNDDIDKEPSEKAFEKEDTSKK